eukprot:TRINITY_DN124787_c0_g1_i1.p1 TRINITY_DN124787_c0_g1~~TRINITY_DN124787_c0_g1_i1.p1  ORF type:complete len:393 (+),score=77.44 TRINITY_DN124787_c0_g1_i1:97-1179(+)
MPALSCALNTLIPESCAHGSIPSNATPSSSDTVASRDGGMGSNGSSVPATIDSGDQRMTGDAPAPEDEEDWYMNEKARSSSSAMPPHLALASLPQLQAGVHSRVSAEALQKLPLSAVKFRALKPEDLDEVIALHTEWFPVPYGDTFYNSSVRGDGEIFSLAAIVDNKTLGIESDCIVSPRPRPEDTENLLGIITMSTECAFHSEDIQSVLGGDCDTLCRKPHVQNPQGNDEDEEERQGCLAYILTLGVVDGFRRKGLAKELLKQLVAYVTAELLHIKAIYLHVVTYNEAAIALYEALQFSRIAEFPAFYQLHGTPYDSYLYALYMQRGKEPWSLRKAFGSDSRLSWTEAASQALRSLWTS